VNPIILAASLLLAAAPQTHNPNSPEEAQVPNRLINETSPYLLQHAYNPVEWHPWGEEAFAEARLRDVPIFLSIGYSTCYWCHVMERESFEDPATAAVMNEHFVCIKVDREERPDVDDLYMTATQIMTGSGGWPMNTFLDPHTLKPFWCGTYFPPTAMQGRPSFTQVLLGMSDVWQSKRDQAVKQAEQLAGAVQEQLAGSTKPAALGSAQITDAVSTLLQIFDRTEGGFGRSPKFPQPVYGLFLLDVRPIVDDETRTAIDGALKLTLDRMAVGGVFDQVGGGFHRYATDANWTVPHFEKMLYDNGQLLSLYARAAALYDDDFYREIAQRIAAYVDREMTGSSGGFFSAQDAEVDSREGLNYLWNAAQIDAVLNESDAEFAKDIYGVTNGANFRDPHHAEDDPSNVLRLEKRPADLAKQLGISLEEFQQIRRRIDTQLLAARDKRKQPSLDDKVLTSWNAMMITGLVQAGEVFDDSAMLDAAQRATDFILTTMRTSTGRLYRSYRKAEGAVGKANHQGVLEDYAWTIIALLELDHAGRGNGEYRKAASDLAEIMHADFADNEGVYTDVAHGRDDLFVRPRSTYDGATPSGIGVAIRSLIVMHSADPQGPWLDRAIAQLGGISQDIAERPVSAVNSVGAIISIIAQDGNADRLKFGETLAQDQSTSNAPDATSSASVVEVYADRESITVDGDTPATLTLGFRIKPGYHILAADPAAPDSEAGQGLIPLRVGLIEGNGIAVYADYPDGDPYGAQIVGTDDLRVHSGEFRIKVAVEKKDGVGAGPGKPVLGVTFQACDDNSCLQPITVRIEVAVNIQ